MSSFNQPFRSRYSKLLERRTDRISRSIHLDERIRAGATSETLKYILGSMLPMDPEYTANTFKEAERLQNQILKGLPERYRVEFDYQGSVTTDTHIRLYSDIDLLALAEAFLSLNPPLVVTSPWTGNPIAHLLEIRRLIIELLSARFPEADVDDEKGKAVGISGGSLSRKIDVVICNWLDTVEYQRTWDKAYRGIRVLDADVPERITNYPFLHNKRLNERDTATGGSAKKLIRFVKSVKADADREIDVSSYDIVGLVYNMPDEYLNLTPGSELNLVSNFHAFGRFLLTSEAYRQTLEVPNRTRKLFGDGGIQLVQLKLLLDEIEPMLPEIQAYQLYGLRRESPRLAEVFAELAVR